MQYVTIKKGLRENKKIYIVNSIILKNTKQNIIQKIPHPCGTEMLEFNTLEEATSAIKRAGFSYILPEGEKEVELNNPEKVKENISNDIDRLIYETFIKKAKAPNSNISSAAIGALAEFPTQDTFDILFEAIGVDSESIRKNAIDGICQHANLLQTRIIDTLKDDNWIKRNSMLSCISKLLEYNLDNLEAYIMPLVETCNDSNPIIQTNAISTLSRLHQKIKREKSK